MNGEELIRYISESKKKTPVKVYLKLKRTAALPEFPGCRCFGDAGSACVVVFGDWKDVKPMLEFIGDDAEDAEIESLCRNSGVPFLDLKDVPARIEPGAMIREQVEIGRDAVIMMGAVLNIGAVVGEGTMVDMNAVLGGRAMVGARCHIGAGAVLAGVIEPAGAQPVMIEDDVMIGANAVILEGVHVGRGAVVAAGSVVTEDVPDGCVAAGIPARVIKRKDAGTAAKTDIVAALRKL